MPDGMRVPRQLRGLGAFVPTEAQKRRDGRALRVFGRLQDGTERREAQAEMNGIVAAAQ